MKSKKKSIGFFLFGLLILSMLYACSSSPPSGGGEIISTEPPTASTDEDSESADPAPATSSDGGVGVPPMGFTLGDPNLRATNPQSVSLASGQIQLIEFFAFW